MPIARNLRHEKRRGILGVGGASRVAWLRNRERRRARGDAGVAEEEEMMMKKKEEGEVAVGDVRIGDGGDPRYRVEAKRTQHGWRGMGRGFLEGGSRSPRGRTRASALHTHTYTRMLYTVLQHRVARKPRSARARCTQA